MPDPLKFVGRIIQKLAWPRHESRRARAVQTLRGSQFGLAR